MQLFPSLLFAGKNKFSSTEHLMVGNIQMRVNIKGPVGLGFPPGSVFAFISPVDAGTDTDESPPAPLSSGPSTPAFKQCKHEENLRTVGCSY